MSNPLDGILDKHRTALDAFKVAKACSSQQDGKLRSSLMAMTAFAAISDEAASLLLKEAQAQLDDLTVLALFSTFERRLREQASSGSKALEATHPSESLGKNLPAFYESQCDYFGVIRVAELFEPSIDKKIIKNIRTIKAYRDWIAHGRNPSNVPASILPLDAYDILTNFLERAGLI